MFTGNPAENIRHVPYKDQSDEQPNNWWLFSATETALSHG